MKKAITLFMALALVTSLFAVPQNHPTKRSIDRKATQASTFSFVSSIPAGWTVSPNPAGYESKDLARGMQMTTTTTITYAGAEDVSSITVTGSTNGDGNSISVKVGTTNFGSVSLTKGDRHNEYEFSGAKSSGNVVITVTRAAKSIWIESVSLDGTGGGGGGGGEETELSGLAQAYAIYYEDGGYYWDFDLAVEFDEETTTYPELYFMCDDEAESKTSIVGTYSAYYAMAWKSAKDSIGTDEEAVGTMTVTYVEEGIYNFVGSFVGTDGQTYTWNATNVEVIAFDADNEYEIIELDEQGGGGGGEGDVTISGLAYADAYYYTYEKVNYWDIDLYKDYDWDTYSLTYPEVYVMTEAKSKTELAGTYTLDYAGYWKSAKDSVENDALGTLTIKCVGESLYDFVGSFVGTDGKTYSWNAKSVDVYAMDADSEEYDEIELTDVPQTAIPEVLAEESYKNTVKTLENGQVMIIRNGQKFNMVGQRVE